MGRLAYFFSTFPLLSETFALAQVKATQKLGLDFRLVANRRPGAGQFHPQDKESLNQTFYLTPVQLRAYAQANFRAWDGSPLTYAKALRLALQLRDGYPWQRFLNLGHLTGAAVLAAYFQVHKVQHVHVHFAYGAAEVALFLKALTGLPYSLSIHGSDVLLPNHLLETKLRGARFIVSNCHYHIQHLRIRYPSLGSQRFYVVPGGVDLDHGLWAESAPHQVDLPLHLLLVARLVPVKAPEVLVQACALLKEQKIPFKCRIVGDGPDRPKLADLIRASCLDQEVEILGFRYQDEVAQLYDWSHVVVLCSHSEGTPMTIIEAMAKARPVVAPRITAIPEMVNDGETGYLFKPGSAVELAEKLAQLAADPSLRIRLGEHARRQALKKFDVMSNARKFLAILAREAPTLGLPQEIAVASE
jgi:colanic acid/amylovoran biosynthesis glycosyltransferase